MWYYYHVYKKLHMDTNYQGPSDNAKQIKLYVLYNQTLLNATLSVVAPPQIGQVVRQPDS